MDSMVSNFNKNIPILPEASLTFASKSSVGPSYAANGQEDHNNHMLNHISCWNLNNKNKNRNENTKPVQTLKKIIMCSRVKRILWDHVRMSAGTPYDGLKKATTIYTDFLGWKEGKKVLFFFCQAKGEINFFTGRVGNLFAMPDPHFLLVTPCPTNRQPPLPIENDSYLTSARLLLKVILDPNWQSFYNIICTTFVFLTPEIQ